MQSVQPSASALDVRGLVSSDALGFASAHRAHVVRFDARRGPKLGPREWLRAAAAFSGRERASADARIEGLLRRVGLVGGRTAMPARIEQLPPAAAAALALVEVALTLVDGEESTVVVPPPPLPAPLRDEIRRLAVDLFAATRLVLVAHDARELAPWVSAEHFIDERGEPLLPPDGRRAMLLRATGTGEAIARLRERLEVLGFDVIGGPLAHRLVGPADLGPRDVLAAAYDAEVDVLEVRALP